MISLEQTLSISIKLVSLSCVIQAAELFRLRTFLVKSKIIKISAALFYAICASLLLVSTLTLSSIFLKTAAILLVLQLCILWALQRPFNGGSDYMTINALVCLSVAQNSSTAAPYAMGYLAIQLTLSYFLAGFAKITEAKWWSGEALKHFINRSSYSVPIGIKKLSQHSTLIQLTSIGLLLVEIGFPIIFLAKITLPIFLSTTLVFHLLNFWVFGLNRFFFAWLACYPALLWLIRNYR